MSQSLLVALSPMKVQFAVERLPTTVKINGELVGVSMEFNCMVVPLTAVKRNRCGTASSHPTNKG
jgi:hypothetical protein